LNPIAEILKTKHTETSKMILRFLETLFFLFLLSLYNYYI
jgi:hypothetical protein